MFNYKKGNDRSSYPHPYPRVSRSSPISISLSSLTQCSLLLAPAGAAQALAEPAEPTVSSRPQRSPPAPPASPESPPGGTAARPGPMASDNSCPSDHRVTLTWGTRGDSDCLNHPRVRLVPVFLSEERSRRLHVHAEDSRI